MDKPGLMSRMRLPRKRMIPIAWFALLASGCSSLAPNLPAIEQQFDMAGLARIDSAIGAVLARRGMPGAVFHIEHKGAAYTRGHGKLAYDAAAGAVDVGTVYDVASLTKVIATAPSVLILAEQGKIDLEAPLTSYFPECANGGKDSITIRHLLTHTSGLPAGLPATPAWHGDEAGHALACKQVVTNAPGTLFRYSDVNYILLGQLVQRVSGQSLNAFAQQHIFAPLKMRDTGFLPLQRMDAARIAPTQQAADGAVLQGVVHDPTSRRMDGVAGSAGVFSTVGDMARYARMVLQGGELEGVRILSRASVSLLTTTQSRAPVTVQRGMGMDIDSPFARPRGTVYPLGSFGHTGFTGCFLWIDPGSSSFTVFLSNRVFPDDKSNILALYSELGTLAAQSLKGESFNAIKR
jgi:CubicO group peptidase (beta-lactamase class C family)